MMCLSIGTAYSTKASNAATTQESSHCHATYFPDNGKLLVPCVDLTDATGNIQSYAAVMDQLSTADSRPCLVKEWSTTQQEFTTQAESSCRAAYVPEYGRWLLPCVDVVDSSGKVESYKVVMGQLDATSVELPKLVVIEVDGENPLGQSSLAVRDFRSTVGTRATAKKPACDFSSEPTGKGKCFGAVGNQCLGGIPSTLGYDKQNPKYDYNTCQVQAYVTAGSQAHDSCCVKNPNGRACQGWSKAEDSPARKKAACSKEWDKAFNDSLWWKGQWMWFGPYYKK